MTSLEFEPEPLHKLNSLLMPINFQNKEVGLPIYFFNKNIWNTRCTDANSKGNSRCTARTPKVSSTHKLVY